jgi:hypothetical protein
MAVLADAQGGPERRALPALVARVSDCLGGPATARDPSPLTRWNGRGWNRKT